MLPTDNTRRPLDRRAVLMTLGLCMIWGAQQAAMKAVATEVAPLMQLSIRFAFAAAFFGAWVLLEEGPGAFGDGTLPGGALMGLLFTLEFVLVGEALVYTSASHTIVFLYTSPIFTALGVRFLPDERLRREQWLGIAIAFLGIVIAFVGPGHRAVTDLMVGDFLALLAGAAWGLSNVVLRRSRLSGASTAKTVLYQVGIAAPLLFAVAAATGQTHLVFTAAAIASLAFQTLVISTSSYLLWFWMLRHYLTSRLML
ncbi:MAG: DMT family transporter, partial [Gammaproteobacteria bacterium]|nr:DMT family transporter [Gammaproteobacteria bacterium]